MTPCSVYRFETELDGEAVRQVSDGCICLRCYTRDTGVTRPLPTALRRALKALLAARDVA